MTDGSLLPVYAIAFGAPAALLAYELIRERIIKRPRKRPSVNESNAAISPAKDEQPNPPLKGEGPAST